MAADRSVIAAALLAVAMATPLAEKVWIHGSADCASSRDPAIDVLRVDADSYVLRQSKCVHAEAPFIYVLFGTHTVFIQDTGATSGPERFPLFETVQGLIAERSARELKILVSHSHSHGDHTAGDGQFRGKKGVTLVEPKLDAVRSHFGFAHWPEGSATIDLGGRELTVFPIPGHQSESVAVYDPHTGWLLTGDTVYPGRLYVFDWTAYRSSIRRLAEFSSSHPVSAVVGTHVEISRTGRLFEVGSTYQPDEAPLPLTVDDLQRLDQLLQGAGSKPAEIRTGKFAVVPIKLWQRVIGRILGWFM
jgi:hydroxyacylglutathione hydrolase